MKKSFKLALTSFFALAQLFLTEHAQAEVNCLEVFKLDVEECQAMRDAWPAYDPITWTVRYSSYGECIALSSASYDHCNYSTEAIKYKMAEEANKRRKATYEEVKRIGEETARISEETTRLRQEAAKTNQETAEVNRRTAETYRQAAKAYEQAAKPTYVPPLPR